MTSPDRGDPDGLLADLRARLDAWINDPAAEARNEAAEMKADGTCTGASACVATKHVHGCYADSGDCDEPTDTAHRVVDPAAPSVTRMAVHPLRLEDADGDVLTAYPAGDAPYLAVLTMAVREQGEMRRVAVGLDRAAASGLRDWLTELLGDGKPPACGESSGPWCEDEVCLLPLGHEGWHKALAATWAPGITHAEWSVIRADEAASYTLVPTPTELARIEETLRYAGPDNAGESPAEVLRFADELDAERDAAAREAGL